MYALTRHGARRVFALAPATLLATALLGGCGSLDSARKLIDPYKNDVVQGNFVSREQVEFIKPCNLCPHMKRITLKNIRRSLETSSHVVEIDPAIFRPATFIEQSLANLRSALGWGCGLVVLILFLFLRDLRSAAISLTAIPLSLLSAVLILSRLGGTLNTMFLAGLVIATGEVVDDAIIDVENIRRRLQQPAGSRSIFDIVRAASIEVRSSVVYASLLVCLVFLPVLVLDGASGAWGRPSATEANPSRMAKAVFVSGFQPRTVTLLWNGV